MLLQPRQLAPLSQTDDNIQLPPAPPPRHIGHGRLSSVQGAQASPV